MQNIISNDEWGALPWLVVVCFCSWVLVILRVDGRGRIWLMLLRLGWWPWFVGDPALPLALAVVEGIVGGGVAWHLPRRYWGGLIWAGRMMVVVGYIAVSDVAYLDKLVVESGLPNVVVDGGGDAAEGDWKTLRGRELGGKSRRVEEKFTSKIFQVRTFNMSRDRYLHMRQQICGVNDYCDARGSIYPEIKIMAVWCQIHHSGHTPPRNHNLPQICDFPDGGDMHKVILPTIGYKLQKSQNIVVFPGIGF
ncbi:uncharacterized protein LACBIDRAFT_325989 [Laccaria bicolor S238N-H82]|uniref:Predicted protein n=1 Tax=Laccaria bicolor (strain S238N-H82 / ATCC MYA-4686) TaxID=486041 RepID=B0D6X2_LACBS|nr:uncharacterized protein LACBIDRAFT_325989 [Laccaria bicolor S238N-H82]EDR09296.1 predicted protein [Laccaria bicolor S238N-H82]|eukprot:XP_001879645.1 predicted protein [Laccaria bicolor S238N-H82]